MATVRMRAAPRWVLVLALVVVHANSAAGIDADVRRGLQRGAEGALLPNAGDLGFSGATAIKNKEDQLESLGDAQRGDGSGVDLAAAAAAQTKEYVSGRARWFRSHSANLREAGKPAEERADRMEDWRAGNGDADVGDAVSVMTASDPRTSQQRAAIAARSARKGLEVAHAALTDASWTERRRAELHRSAEDADRFVASLRRGMTELRTALVSVTRQLRAAETVPEQQLLSAHVEKLRARLKTYAATVRAYAKRDHTAHAAASRADRLVKAAFTRVAAHLAAGELDAMIAAAEQLVAKRDATNNARATQALWQDLDVPGRQRATLLRKHATQAVDRLQKARGVLANGTVTEAGAEPGTRAEVDVDGFVNTANAVVTSLPVEGEAVSDDEAAARAEDASRRLQPVVKAVEGVLIVKAAVASRAARITLQEHDRWDGEVRRLTALARNHAYWAKQGPPAEREDNRKAAARIHDEELPAAQLRLAHLKAALSALEQSHSQLSYAERAVTKLSRDVAGALFADAVRREAAAVNGTASMPVHRDASPLVKVRDVWHAWQREVAQRRGPHAEAGVAFGDDAAAAAASAVTPTGATGPVQPSLSAQFDNDEAMVDRITEVARGELPTWAMEDVGGPNAASPGQATGGAGTGIKGIAGQDGATVGAAGSVEPSPAEPVPTLAQVMAQADRDGDGTLSQREFSVAVEVVAPGSGMRPAEAARMFRLADLDGDGVLSEEEARQWMDAEALKLREGWWLQRINGMATCEIAGDCARTTAITPAAQAEEAVLFRELARAALDVARGTEDAHGALADLRDRMSDIAGVRPPRTPQPAKVVPPPPVQPKTYPEPPETPAPEEEDKETELERLRRLVRETKSEAAMKRGDEFAAQANATEKADKAQESVETAEEAEQAVSVVEARLKAKRMGKSAKLAEAKEREEKARAAELRKEVEHAEAKVGGGGGAAAKERAKKLESELKAAEDGEKAAAKATEEAEEESKKAEAEEEDADVEEKTHTKAETEAPFEEVLAVSGKMSDAGRQAMRASEAARSAGRKAAVAMIGAEAAKAGAEETRAEAEAAADAARQSLERVRAAELKYTREGRTHAEVPTALYREERDASARAHELEQEAQQKEKTASDRHADAVKLVSEAATLEGKADALLVSAEKATADASDATDEAERNAEQLADGSEGESDGEDAKMAEQLAAQVSKEELDAEQARVVAVESRKRADAREKEAAEAEERAIELRHRSMEAAEAAKEARSSAEAAERDAGPELAKDAHTRADAEDRKANDAYERAIATEAAARRLREAADADSVEAGAAEHQARATRKRAEAGQRVAKSWAAPAAHEAEAVAVRKADKAATAKARRESENAAIASEIATAAAEKADKKRAVAKQARKAVEELEAAGASAKEVAAQKEAAEAATREADEADRRSADADREARNSAELAQREAELARQEHEENEAAATRQQTEREESKEEATETKLEKAAEEEEELEGPLRGEAGIEEPLGQDADEEEEDADEGPEGEVTPETATALSRAAEANQMSKKARTAAQKAERAHKEALVSRRAAVRKTSYAETLGSRADELDEEKEQAAAATETLRRQGAGPKQVAAAEDRGAALQLMAKKTRQKADSARADAEEATRRADELEQKEVRAAEEAVETSRATDAGLERAKGYADAAHEAAARRRLRAARMAKEANDPVALSRRLQQEATEMETKSFELQQSMEASRSKPREAAREAARAEVLEAEVPRVAGLLRSAEQASGGEETRAVEALRTTSRDLKEKAAAARSAADVAQRAADKAAQTTDRQRRSLGAAQEAVVSTAGQLEGVYEALGHGAKQSGGDGTASGSGSGVPEGLVLGRGAALPDVATMDAVLTARRFKVQAEQVGSQQSSAARASDAATKSAQRQGAAEGRKAGYETAVELVTAASQSVAAGADEDSVVGGSGSGSGLAHGVADDADAEERKLRRRLVEATEAAERETESAKDMEDEARAAQGDAASSSHAVVATAEALKEKSAQVGKKEAPATGGGAKPEVLPDGTEVPPSAADVDSGAVSSTTPSSAEEEGEEGEKASTLPPALAPRPALDAGVARVGELRAQAERLHARAERMRTKARADAARDARAAGSARGKADAQKQLGALGARSVAAVKKVSTKLGCATPPPPAVASACARVAAVQQEVQALVGAQPATATAERAKAKWEKARARAADASRELEKGVESLREEGQSLRTTLKRALAAHEARWNDQPAARDALQDTLNLTAAALGTYKAAFADLRVMTEVDGELATAEFEQARTEAVEREVNRWRAAAATWREGLASVVEAARPNATAATVAGVREAAASLKGVATELGAQHERASNATAGARKEADRTRVDAELGADAVVGGCEAGARTLDDALIAADAASAESRETETTSSIDSAEEAAATAATEREEALYAVKALGDSDDALASAAADAATARAKAEVAREARERVQYDLERARSVADGVSSAGGDASAARVARDRVSRLEQAVEEQQQAVEDAEQTLSQKEAARRESSASARRARQKAGEAVAAAEEANAEQQMRVTKAQELASAFEDDARTRDPRAATNSTLRLVDKARYAVARATMLSQSAAQSAERAGEAREQVSDAEGELMRAEVAVSQLDKDANATTRAAANAAATNARLAAEAKGEASERFKQQLMAAVRKSVLAVHKADEAARATTEEARMAQWHVARATEEEGAAMGELPALETARDVVDKAQEHVRALGEGVTRALEAQTRALAANGFDKVVEGLKESVAGLEGASGLADDAHRAVSEAHRAVGEAAVRGPRVSLEATASRAAEMAKHAGDTLRSALSKRSEAAERADDARRAREETGYQTARLEAVIAETERLQGLYKDARDVLATLRRRGVPEAVTRPMAMDVANARKAAVDSMEEVAATQRAVQRARGAYHTVGLARQARLRLVQAMERAVAAGDRAWQGVRASISVVREAQFGAAARLADRVLVKERVAVAAEAASANATASANEQKREASRLEGAANTARESAEEASAAARKAARELSQLRLAGAGAQMVEGAKQRAAQASQYASEEETVASRLESRAASARRQARAAESEATRALAEAESARQDADAAVSAAADEWKEVKQSAEAEAEAAEGQCKAQAQRAKEAADATREKAKDAEERLRGGQELLDEARARVASLREAAAAAASSDDASAEAPKAAEVESAEAEARELEDEVEFLEGAVTEAWKAAQSRGRDYEDAHASCAHLAARTAKAAREATQAKSALLSAMAKIAGAQVQELRAKQQEQKRQAKAAQTALAQRSQDAKRLREEVLVQQREELAAARSKAADAGPTEDGVNSAASAAEDAVEQAERAVLGTMGRVQDAEHEVATLRERVETLAEATEASKASLSTLQAVARSAAQQREVAESEGEGEEGEDVSLVGPSPEAQASAEEAAAAQKTAAEAKERSASAVNAAKEAAAAAERARKQVAVLEEREARAQERVEDARKNAEEVRSSTRSSASDVRLADRALDHARDQGHKAEHAARAAQQEAEAREAAREQAVLEARRSLQERRRMRESADDASVRSAVTTSSTNLEEGEKALMEAQRQEEEWHELEQGADDAQRTAREAAAEVDAAGATVAELEEELKALENETKEGGEAEGEAEDEGEKAAEAESHMEEMRAELENQRRQRDGLRGESEKAEADTESARARADEAAERAKEALERVASGEEEKQKQEEAADAARGGTGEDGPPVVTLPDGEVVEDPFALLRELDPKAGAGAGGDGDGSGSGTEGEEVAETEAEDEGPKKPEAVVAREEANEAAKLAKDKADAAEKQRKAAADQRKAAEEAADRVKALEEASKSAIKHVSDAADEKTRKQAQKEADKKQTEAGEAQRASEQASAAAEEAQAAAESAAKDATEAQHSSKEADEKASKLEGEPGATKSNTAPEDAGAEKSAALQMVEARKAARRAEAAAGKKRMEAAEVARDAADAEQRAARAQRLAEARRDAMVKAMEDAGSKNASTPAGQAAKKRAEALEDQARDAEREAQRAADKAESRRSTVQEAEAAARKAEEEVIATTRVAEENTEVARKKGVGRAAAAAAKASMHAEEVKAAATHLREEADRASGSHTAAELEVESASERVQALEEARVAVQERLARSEGSGPAGEQEPPVVNATGSTPALARVPQPQRDVLVREGILPEAAAADDEALPADVEPVARAVDATLERAREALSDAREAEARAAKKAEALEEEAKEAKESSRVAQEEAKSSLDQARAAARAAEKARVEALAKEGELADKQATIVEKEAESAGADASEAEAEHTRLARRAEAADATASAAEETATQAEEAQADSGAGTSWEAAAGVRRRAEKLREAAQRAAEQAQSVDAAAKEKRARAADAKTEASRAREEAKQAAAAAEAAAAREGAAEVAAQKQAAAIAEQVAASRAQAYALQQATAVSAASRMDALKEEAEKAETKAEEAEGRLERMREENEEAANAGAPPKHDDVAITFATKVAERRRQQAAAAGDTLTSARKAKNEEERRAKEKEEEKKGATQEARTARNKALAAVAEMTRKAAARIGAEVVRKEKKVAEAEAEAEAAAAHARNAEDESAALAAEAETAEARGAGQDVTAARTRADAAAREASEAAEAAAARKLDMQQARAALARVRDRHHAALDDADEAVLALVRALSDQAGMGADEQEHTATVTAKEAEELEDKVEQAQKAAQEATQQAHAADATLEKAQERLEQVQTAGSQGAELRDAGKEVARAKEARRLARAKAAERGERVANLQSQTEQRKQDAASARTAAEAARSDALSSRLHMLRTEHSRAESRALRMVEEAGRARKRADSADEAAREAEAEASEASIESSAATRQAARAARRVVEKRVAKAGKDAIAQAEERASALTAAAKEAATKVENARAEADSLRDEADELGRQARQAHMEAVDAAKSAHHAHVALLQEIASQRDDSAQVAEDEATEAERKADARAETADEAAAAASAAAQKVAKAEKRVAAVSADDTTAQAKAKAALTEAQAKSEAARARAEETAEVAAEARRASEAANAASEEAAAQAEEAENEATALQEAGFAPVPPTTEALDALRASKATAAAQAKAVLLRKRAIEASEEAEEAGKAATAAETRAALGREKVERLEQEVKELQQAAEEEEQDPDATAAQVRDAKAELARARKEAKSRRAAAEAKRTKADEADAKAEEAATASSVASENAKRAQRRAKEDADLADEKFTESEQATEEGSALGMEAGVRAVERLHRRLSDVVESYAQRMSGMKERLHTLYSQAGEAAQNATNYGGNTAVATFARQLSGAAREELDEAAEAWSTVEGVSEHMASTVASLKHMLKVYAISPAFRKHTGRMLIEKIEVKDTRRAKEWTHVRFPVPFKATPVVITTPEMRGGSPMTLRVRNVTRVGFSVVPIHAAPQGGQHDRQIVFYMAATPGRHALLDGTLVEVGREDVEETQTSPDCGKELARQNEWHELRFSSAFPGSPTFLTQLQSTANEDNKVPHAVASPFLTVAVGHVGASGARVALERGQSRSGTVARAETVGYVAVMQHTGAIMDPDLRPVYFETFLSFPQVRGISRGNFYVGSRSFLGRDPVVFANMASRNNARGGWVRKQSASKWHHYFRLDNTNECGTRDLPEYDSVSVFMMTEAGDYPLYEPMQRDLESEAAKLDGIEEPTPEAREEAEKKSGNIRDATMELGWARFRHTGIDPRFSIIRFKQEYDEPPLVFFLNDRSDREPADIRIKKVTTKLVVAAVVEPPRYRGPHANEEVPYLAIERGTARLPDGTVVEAGEIETNATQYDPDCVKHDEASRWSRALFNHTFLSAPSVVTRIQTMNNERGGPPRGVSTPFLSSAVKGIDKEGLHMALERSRVGEGGSAALRPERVAYVAFQRGLGSFVAAHDRQVRYEFDITAPMIRGLNMGCQFVGLRQLYNNHHRHRAPPLVLADKATHNSNEGGFMRYCGHHRWTQHWAVRLMVDKDTSCSPDRSHAYERASLAVFSDPFVLRRGGVPPAPKVEKSPLPPTSPDRMEASFAVLRDTWKSTQVTKVWFEKPFKRPPLVFLLPSEQGWHSVSVRVFDVSYEYFKVSLVVPLGTSRAHHAQVVPYIAIEPGQHRLPDGSVVEAGAVGTKAQQYALKCYNHTVASEEGRSWDSVQFNHTFDKEPVLLTQIQGMANEHMHPPRTPSMPFLTTVTRDTTAAGTKLALERGHMGLMGVVGVPEQVGYLAIEPSTSSFEDDDGKQIKYQAFARAEAVRGMERWPSSSYCSSVDFIQQYDQHPVVVASLGSRNNDKGGWLRLCGRGAGRRHLFLTVEQDYMCGSAHHRPHDPEDIFALIFSRPFTRTLYNMDDDPLAEAARIAMAEKQAEMRRLLAKRTLDVAALAEEEAEEAVERTVDADDSVLVRKADLAEYVARKARETAVHAQRHADLMAGESLQAAAEVQRAERHAKETAAELEGAKQQLEQARAAAEARGEEVGAGSNSTANATANTTANSTANATAVPPRSDRVHQLEQEVARLESAVGAAKTRIERATEQRDQRKSMADAAKVESNEAFMNATELVDEAAEARSLADLGSRGAQGEDQEEEGEEGQAFDPAKFRPEEPGLQPVLAVIANMRASLRRHIALGEQEMDSAASLVQYLQGRLEQEGHEALQQQLGRRANVLEQLTEGIAQTGKAGAGAWDELYGALDSMRTSVTQLRGVGRTYEADPFFRTITGRMVMEKVYVDSTYSTRGATHIRFPRPFLSAPVVITMPTTQGRNVPATLRVRNVTRDGFDVVPVQASPQGPYHHGMTIFYMAATPGRHALQDGALVEVGVEEVKATQISPDCGAALARQNAWHELRFSTPMPSMPALLTQVQTMENEAGSVPRTTSRPFLTVAVGELTARGARVALERGQSRSGEVKRAEKVGYVAMSQGARSTLDPDFHPISYESFVTFPQVGSVTRGSSYVGSRTLLGRDPVVFGSLASRNNPRGGWLRKHAIGHWLRSRYFRGHYYHGHYFGTDTTTECGSRNLPHLESVSVVAFSESGEYTLFRPLKGDAVSPDAMVDAVVTKPRDPPVSRAEAKKLGLPAPVGDAGASMESGWARFDHTALEAKWSVIRFKQVYAEPPLVFFLNGRRDGEPADIRIKEVTTKYVVAAVVEPAKYRGPHANEQVPFLAVARGVQRLPDGTVVEAGEIETNATQYDRDCVGHAEAKRWEAVSFQSPFDAAPSVVTRIQTVNNEEHDLPGRQSAPFLSSAVKGISKYRFSLALERSRVSEGGSTLRPERVAYVAFQRGLGSFRDSGGQHIQYEFDITPAVVRGLNMGCQHVGLRRTMNWYRRHQGPPLVLADKATHNSNEGGFMRYCGHEVGTQHWAVRLMVDKDTSCSPDRSHAYERASLAVFSDPFTLRTSESSHTALQDYHGDQRGPGMPSDGPTRLEAGWMHLSDTHLSRERTHIWFRKPFKTPPLVFTLPTRYHWPPVEVRIHAVYHDYMVTSLVSPTGYSHRHRGQVVPYIAVEPGVHQLPDGTVVEAGVHATKAQQFNRFYRRDGTSWEHMQFQHAFGARPAVLTRIQGAANEHAHPPTSQSVPFLSVALNKVTNRGADVALERTGSGYHGHIARPERVAYLAVETGRGRFHADGGDEVLWEAVAQKKAVDHGCRWVRYGKSMPSNAVAVGSLASRTDQQGGWARVCAPPNQGSPGLRLRIDFDRRTRHWRYLVRRNRGRLEESKKELAETKKELVEGQKRTEQRVQELHGEQQRHGQQQPRHHRRWEHRRWQRRQWELQRERRRVQNDWNHRRYHLQRKVNMLKHRISYLKLLLPTEKQDVSVVAFSKPFSASLPAA